MTIQTLTFDLEDTSRAYRLGLKSGQPPIPSRSLAATNGERNGG